MYSPIHSGFPRAASLALTKNAWFLEVPSRNGLMQAEGTIKTKNEQFDLLPNLGP